MSPSALAGSLRAVRRLPLRKIKLKPRPARLVGDELELLHRLGELERSEHFTARGDERIEMLLARRRLF